MWKKIVLVLIVCALLAAFLWWWAWISVLQHGRTRVVKVGGGWQMRYHESPMDHSGGEAALERTGAGSPVVVEGLVQIFRYLGDDCVLYEASHGERNPQYFAACADLQPLVVTEPGRDDWSILPDGLQKMEWVGDAKKPTGNLPWSEIKARAMKQPRR